jgi:uncharacterized heparinase superfamily protein
MRRAALARLLLSPALRWRYGAAVADELLIVPRDLRTGDPSFFDELKAGQIGLGGFVAPLEGRSPFALPAPSKPWARELHGFGWLRHLRVRRELEADEAARELVCDWIKGRRRTDPVAREPQVIGRRIISWITCANMLLGGEDQARYDLVTDSLADQLIHLSATWRDASDGYPRLLAVTALLYADLCVAGRDRQLKGAEALFTAEVGRQILPDGCHISRNPGLLVELLLDFLPLNQCFKSRNRTPPAALQSAIDRMLLLVQHLRLGDGTIARFNGVGPAADDAVATVMAYLPSDMPALAAAPSSGYVRLAAGDTVVVVDAGAAPPLEFTADAHAGCLSFELSSGHQAILVNGGAPGMCDQDWRSAARGTASHNTVSIGGKSSAKLVRNVLLEKLLDAIPLRHPERVDAELSADRRRVVARHDGYLGVFGLVHKRTLALSENGRKLTGRDEIGAPAGRMRLANDLPFAVHFHLHKRATARLGRSPDTVEIHLAGGELWLFSASGGVISIEDSVHYADLAGPVAVEQIVIRGACPGESTIDWTLEGM